MRLNHLAYGAIVTIVVSPCFAEAKITYSEAEIRSVETEREFQIAKLREGEIQQLKIAIGHRMDNSKKADLYFRLAELYLESYRNYFILEGRVHSKRIRAGNKEVVLDRSRSRPYLLKGIEACQKILTLAPSYSKMDRVVYFLAFNNDELGNMKSSIAYYNKIIQEFPNSPFRAEAYRELGNYAFQQNDYKKAQVYYQLALKVPGVGKQPDIMHALAWSYYRTRQFDLAISTMKQAIAAASEDQERFLSIQEEALRDMAIFMTERGQVEEAIDYFKEVAGDKTFLATTLERLGKEYERKVQPAKAVKVYEALMKARPDSESAFRVLVKLVDLDLRRGAYGQALKRVQNQEVSFSDDVETKVARTNLMSKIRRTATSQHEEYRRSKSKTARLVAEKYYEVYIDKFLVQQSDVQEKREVQMYLAELKLEDQSYYEAANLYKEVFDSEDRRYFQEAGVLWIGSLSKQLEQAAKLRKETPSTSPSEIEISFVKAADRLFQKVPNSKDTREALLRSAQILAGYPSTKKQAQARAQLVVERYPQTRQAQTASILWLQLVGDELDQVVATNPEKYLETAGRVMKVVDEIEGNAELIDYAKTNQGVDLFKELSSRKLGVRVGIIRVYENRGELAKAGKEYLGYANEAPDKKASEKAFEGAFRTFLASKSWKDLDQTVGDWMIRFPKNSQAQEYGRRAASFFFVHGRFRLAASRFEKLGLHGRDSKLLETAGRIYYSISEWSRARAVLLTLLADYRKSIDLGEIYFTLFEVEKRLGNSVAAAGSLENCVKYSRSLQAKCAAKLGDLYFEAGKTVEAKKEYQSVASQSRGRSVSPYVGYAQYQLSYMLEREQHFVPLELPEPILKDGLAERMQFLKQLRASYLRSVTLGGVWGISALYRLGKWIGDLADEIDRIAPPLSMDADEKKVFEKTLSAFSKPLRDQAVQLWNDAIKKSKTSTILSPSLPMIGNELFQIDAKIHPIAQGYRGKMRLAGQLPNQSTGGKEEQLLEKIREDLTKNPGSSEGWVEYGNLLWQTGKFRLAEFSYDRALSINPKDSAAINNRAVVNLMAKGLENWEAAQEAYEQFLIVEKSSKYQSIGKFNAASLLNYYRLYPNAIARWKDIVSNAKFADAYDGYAIALLGLGRKEMADQYFQKANALGAEVNRFSFSFHQAAQAVTQKDGKCQQTLATLQKNELRGFEVTSYRSLERTCGP